MEKIIIIYCTTPNESCANQIADQLVKNRLSACVSILPTITSTYRWEGKVEKTQEILLMIKTRQSCFSAIRDQIISLHPYDVPEIIATPITDSLSTYTDWVRAETC